MYKLLPILTVFLFLACSKTTETKTIEAKPVKQANTDNIVIADTIIYDVVIKNNEPGFEWNDHCLQYFKQKDFVDQVFSRIYAKELTAYDVFSGDKLSISDIKSIEKRDDFKRSNVGKIQFYEKWFLDEKQFQFKKEIFGFKLGYENFDSQGNLKGYKPLFEIRLNPDHALD